MAGIVLMVAGLIVAGVGLIGRAGKLPRNHFVGIRLPSTMRSAADSEGGTSPMGSNPKV